MASRKMVKHVVLDSGAFLRNAPIKDIAEEAYTLQEVIREIKDKATRQRLQVLPYELKFKEPSQDALNFVTDFAKKTGDYGSLSAVDIRVMALTYQLEKEMKGTNHLKMAPEKKVEWQSSARPLEKVTDIAGFYIQKKKSQGSRTTSECSSTLDQPELRQDEVRDKQEVVLEKIGMEEPNCDRSCVKQEVSLEKTCMEPVCENNTNHEHTNTVEFQSCVNENNLEIEGCKDSEIERERLICEENYSNLKSQKDKSDLHEGDIITAEQLDEDGDEEEVDDEDEEEEEEDDDGWITPSNIKAIKEKMGGDDKEEQEVAVGCLTTDFAMQNVLIQMGLNVISVDGMLIKRAKSFVLRCHACMKITTNTQKVFCPHCGNKTLTKLSMTVKDDGSIHYFLSRRRPVTGRGTKFSLPLPKGGKHAENPVLVEDQPIPQNRAPRKALATLDVFDPDYCAGTSPFAINDVTSRASQLGIRRGHCWDKRNPNMKRKGGKGRRK